MTQRRRMVAFITIVTGLRTLLHVYVGERLLAQESLPIVWRVLGWTGIVLLATGPVVALCAARSERLPARGVVEVAGLRTMGLASLPLVTARAGDALELRARRRAGC